MVDVVVVVVVVVGVVGVVVDEASVVLRSEKLTQLRVEQYRQRPLL